MVDAIEVESGQPFVIAADTAPWIGIAAGAAVAALGYVGKLATESLREWRRAEAESLAQLFKLQALLRASGAAFKVQNDLARRLASRLETEHPNDLPEEPGFEMLFSHLYPRFTPEEGELHGIIRAYSEHALYPINAAMAEWLRGDVRHRTPSRAKSERELRLTDQLNQLDAHLLLWLAKYQGWIPDRPERALVYLDDEEKHGVRFPRAPNGVEKALDDVLAERSPGHASRFETISSSPSESSSSSSVTSL